MFTHSNIHKEKGILNLGLIGRKLLHSFSKKYFEEKYGISTYELVELDTIGELPEAVERLDLNGFNVTIPYKCDIIPLLDKIDPSAHEIGAVNTVVRYKKDDNRWGLHGYNTDAQAFRDTLQPHLLPHHRHALILGSGGASRAVAWALGQLGIEYQIVSRSPLSHPATISYDKARELVAGGDYTVIVNTTPVGMYPVCDATPWPWTELIGSQHLCYDLIYNPSPTLFLEQAAGRRAKTIDGLAMLHRQADLALEIWERAHNNN